MAEAQQRRLVLRELSATGDDTIVGSFDSDDGIDFFVTFTLDHSGVIVVVHSEPELQAAWFGTAPAFRSVFGAVRAMDTARRSAVT